MKRLFEFFGKCMFAAIAGAFLFAAAEPIVDLVNSARPQWFQSGVYIGTAGTNPVGNTTNKVTNQLASTQWATAVNVTINANTCYSNSAQTISGATLFDACTLAVNPAWPVGVGSGGCQVIATTGQVNAFACNSTAAAVTIGSTAVTMQAYTRSNQ